MWEDVGGAKLVTFKGVVEDFDVALIFLFIGGCEENFLFVFEDVLGLALLGEDCFDLVLEVVDVGVEGDGLHDVLLAVEGVDGLSGGVGDGVNSLQGSALTDAGSHYLLIIILRRKPQYNFTNTNKPDR